MVVGGGGVCVDDVGLSHNTKTEPPIIRVILIKEW